MRTLLLSVLYFSTSVATLAQLTAGDVPPGSSVQQGPAPLILSAPFTTSSATIDLDCDSVADLRFVLIKGEPMLDAPNVAQVEILRPDLELCMSNSAPHRPQYHYFGTSMDCTGAFTWQSDSVNALGDFGSFTAIGPVVVDTMYFAYRVNGTTLGWVRLSFILNNSLSVSLWVHEVLTYCTSMGVAESGAPPVVLFPNPTSGGDIHLESPRPVMHVEVADAIGRTVARYGEGTGSFTVPAAAGTYWVRVHYADGAWSTGRVVRH